MPLSLSWDSTRWGLSPPNAEEPGPLGPLRTAAAAGTAPLCAQGAGPPPGPQAHMGPTLNEHMSSRPG